MSAASATGATGGSCTCTAPRPAARLVGARRPDGLLPRPAADSEQAVRAWLLAVLAAAEADE